MRRVAVVLVICAGAGRAAADQCAAAVLVSGDERAADEIRRSLAARGLVDDVTGRCPLVHARVEQQRGGLRVEVTDGYGRRSQRLVGDTETAGVLIESWVRPEVVVDDLRGASELSSDAPVAAPSRPTAVAAIVTTAPRVPASGVALLLGARTADDGSTWMRVDAAGCRSVGRVCVGGRVAWARDLRTGTSAHPRMSTGAGALVELPWALGRLAVVPGLGASIAWDRVGEIGPHLDQHEDVVSARLAATAALRAPLSRRWTFTAELGGDVTVLGGAATVPGALAGLAIGVRHGEW